MKNLLITTLSLALFSSVTFAQIPVHFGIKLGANYSSMESDIDAIKTDAAAGFLGGVFARVDLPKNLLIQPEVYYSIKKSTIKTPSIDLNGEPITREDEVEKGDLDLALLLGYKLVDTKLFNLRLMAGAVNSMNVSDNLAKDVEEYEKSSMGYQVGIGADVAKFTFDIRYEGSFGDIQKDVKYKGYQLAIGFKFI